MDIFNLSRDRLLDDFESLQQSYKQGKPCPHLVIDNLFDTQILNSILREFPLNRDRDLLNWEISEERKVKSQEVGCLSDLAITFYFWLNSQDFIHALNPIVARDRNSLISDPFFYGAGLYEIAPGGQLESNDDIIVHPNLPLICKFNLIICLNKYWNSDWGGKIEIHSFQDTNHKVSYTTRFNRTIILPITGQNLYRLLTSDRSERSSKFLSIFYWGLIPM